VVWRHEDIVHAALNAGRLGAPIESVEQLAAEAAANESPMTLLACGPMMHGGSQWILGNGHVAGYTVALYTQPSFTAEKILDLEKAGVNSLTFLGDAMGRPVAEAILSEPDRWDLSSLAAVSNGAAPLSDAVRDEIRRALPGRFILDSYGSSESGTTGSRLDDGSDGAPAGAPKFGVGADVEVVDADMRPGPPGGDGMLGRTGSIPLGHYNDPEKTAATFKEIDGARWAIPGDFARREEDGSVTVLGRGSVCINTGGEKVHPEEVEATMPRHPAVADAVVIGTPHKRWGQQVTALVQVREGAAVTAEDLRAHVRSLSPATRCPRRSSSSPRCRGHR
jgi:3-oxocholest-4-en-26-oate---CoA ligase